MTDLTVHIQSFVRSGRLSGQWWEKIRG